MIACLSNGDVVRIYCCRFHLKFRRIQLKDDGRRTVSFDRFYQTKMRGAPVRHEIQNALGSVILFYLNIACSPAFK